MDRYAIWSTMTAKSGQEQAAEAFLAQCLDLIGQEPGTTRFLVLREAPGRYAIFDTFAHDEAFQAHLNGPVPKVLQAKSADLFEEFPVIVRSEILAVK
ncbi:MAG: antibiotic biosynthesis monooxygenase [Acetobacteraceae bacterium]